MSFLKENEKKNKNYQMQINLKNYGANNNLFNYILLGTDKNNKFIKLLNLNIKEFPHIDLQFINEKQKNGRFCLCNQHIKNKNYIINKHILNNRLITKSYDINNYVFIIGTDCANKFIDIRKNKRGNNYYLRCSCGNWHNNDINGKCDICTVILEQINKQKKQVKPLLENSIKNKSKKIKDIIYAESLINKFKNNKILVNCGIYKDSSLKTIFLKHYNYIKYLYSLKYSSKKETIDYNNEIYFLNKTFDIIKMIEKLKKTLDFLYKEDIIKCNKFSQLLIGK